MMNLAMLNLTLIKQQKFQEQSEVVRDIFPILKDFVSMFEGHLR